MLDALYQAIDPIAFQIGPVAVRWYGIAYVLGFLLAGLIIYRVAKRWKLGITVEDLLVIVLCVMVGVIVGARLGYCLFYGDGYYLAHPLDILAFNQGGMSFHGGLIGALVAGAVAAGVGLTCTAEPDTAAGVTLGAGVPSFCKPPDCVSTLVRLPSLIRCG